MLFPFIIERGVLSLEGVLVKLALVVEVEEMVNLDVEFGDSFLMAQKKRFLLLDPSLFRFKMIGKLGV